MNIQEHINRQRVKHIISSYQLEGDDPIQIESWLEEWFQIYPTSLMELALVETLVDQWLTVPPVRGVAFFKRVQTCLKTWENQPIVSTITPEQFQHITGLDPVPIFGSEPLSTTRPISYPS